MTGGLGVRARVAAPGKAAALARLLAASLLAPAGARLGDTSASDAHFGYQFSATSTVYGPAPRTACGGVDTEKLVEGTGYIAVASAQSMQPVYANALGCSWECVDAQGKRVESCQYSTCGGDSDPTVQQGCTCRQVGSCWCGAAAAEGPPTGTARMGCFSCAKGRFTRTRPYGSPMEGAASDATGQFSSGEIKVVVADACPYGPNTKWCPASPGAVNACGQKNHLDFTVYPGGVNNNYFVFTPEPCSAQLQQRIASMSQCAR